MMIPVTTWKSESTSSCGIIRNIKIEDKEGSKRHKPWPGSVPLSGERRALFISLALLMLLLLMLILEYVPRAGRFEVGKPSTETVISARDFSVIDEESTEKAREAERQRIKSLFINPEKYAAAVSGLEGFFNHAEILSAQDGSLEQKISQLKAYAPPSIDENIMGTLLISSNENKRILYINAVELLTLAMSDPVSFDNLDKVRKEISAMAGNLHLEETALAGAVSLAAAFTGINTDYPSATIQGNIDAPVSY